MKFVRRMIIPRGRYNEINRNKRVKNKKKKKKKNKTS